MASDVLIKAGTQGRSFPKPIHSLMAVRPDRQTSAAASLLMRFSFGEAINTRCSQTQFSRQYISIEHAVNERARNAAADVRVVAAFPQAGASGSTPLAARRMCFAVPAIDAAAPADKNRKA